MYYLARAGIEKAISELERKDDTPNYDSLNEKWSNDADSFKEMPLDGGYVTVSYQLKDSCSDSHAVQGSGAVTFYGVEDESSKININKAPLQILKSMLKNIGGMEEDEAADAAAAIVDWRDKDIIVSSGGAENDYYKGLKPPYPCKNGEFQIPEELLLVKGISPQVYSKISRVITVYGGGKVNINTAGREVLRALGLSSELVSKIIRFRRGNDGIEGTKDDNIFKSVGEIKNIGYLFTEESEEISRLISLNVLSVKTDVFRISSSGILKRNSRMLHTNIVCVVRILAKKPPQILYWHEG